MVISERVAVEAREAFRCAEPEEAVRVWMNAEDLIAGQAVSAGVGTDRQTAGVQKGGAEQEENPDISVAPPSHDGLY